MFLFFLYDLIILFKIYILFTQLVILLDSLLNLFLYENVLYFVLFISP